MTAKDTVKTRMLLEARGGQSTSFMQSVADRSSTRDALLKFLVVVGWTPARGMLNIQRPDVQSWYRILKAP
jgi:hypothetical protein